MKLIALQSFAIAAEHIEAGSEIEVVNEDTATSLLLMGRVKLAPEPEVEPPAAPPPPEDIEERDPKPEQHHRDPKHRHHR